jgi:Kef-type K+ transport system membrane component KefB
VSFNGLLIISVIAVAAPILAASVKRVKLPSAVVEIVAGIIVGPSVLAWVNINQPVNVVALLGLAFLLFLAGLEIDLRATTPRRLRAPLAGFAGSLMLGAVAGAAFHTVGWVRDPFFLAITLAATSIGLVAPILADAGLSETVLGQLIIAGATAGEFGAITLLTLFFSETKDGTASEIVTFGIFGAVVAAVGVTLGRAGRNIRLDAFLTRLQGHDRRDPGAHRRRPAHRLRGPRGESRTADHPRRLPCRRGAQLALTVIRAGRTQTQPFTEEG